MLGASALSEYSISDQSILLAGVSEQTAISSAVSVGVGILSGVTTVDSNFTQSSNAIYISAGANAELSTDTIMTSAGLRARLGVSEIESAFTKTSNGIMIRSGVATKDFNFTQDTFGELLFEDINAGANPEIYTAITPSGTETWTTVTPSGSESWTEIEIE
jgi:Zn-dependent alcohol dehydrogenase